MGKRIIFLRELLAKENLDCLLVSDFHNVSYLSGFQTLSADEQEAFILVTRRSAYLFTNENYQPDKLGLEEKGINTVILTREKSLTARLQEITVQENIRYFGIEGESMSVLDGRRLEERLKNTMLKPTEGLIIRQRAIKDGKEIKNLQQAAKLVDSCLEEIMPTIKVGDTERDIACRLEKWTRQKEAEPAFLPIVAVGANSSVPHYHTALGYGRVVKDSLLLIDYGIRYRGYCSDITRMVFIGKMSSDIATAYRVLKNAQEKTVRQIKSGGKWSDIDQFCRRQIEAVNLPVYRHSTGHGVGLEVHEFPKVASASLDMIRSGQAATVEPGIYFPGRWGMRLEDTVFIKKDGRPETLTNCSREIVNISA